MNQAPMNKWAHIIMPILYIYKMIDVWKVVGMVARNILLALDIKQYFNIEE